MNDLKAKLVEMTGGDEKKLVVYGVALAIALLFLVYVLKTSSRPRDGVTPNPPPGAAQPAAGQPVAGAPGAAVVSASNVIPPEVEAVVQEFKALTDDQKHKFLSASVGLEIASGSMTIGGMPRLGVKADPFHPEAGKGSEIKIAGRPSLIPQLVEDVEAAKAQGIEVPEVLTYKTPEPMPDFSAELASSSLVLPPDLPGLPPFPVEGSGQPGEITVVEELLPKKQPLPYRVAGVVVDSDALAIITNDQGKSLFARIGTQLEPGTEVVAIGKDYVKVKTPDGIEELKLMGSGEKSGEGTAGGANEKLNIPDNSAPLPVGGAL